MFFFPSGHLEDQCINLNNWSVEDLTIGGGERLEIAKLWRILVWR